MFTLKLLQAINDWQMGGDETAKRVRGERLAALAQELPAEYRQCSSACFRRLSLTSQSVWKVGTECELAETISSWTTSLDVAQVFKNGVPPKGYQGVIFCHVPASEEVVVSLPAMFSSKEFRDAIKENKNEIKNYQKGLGRYGATQQEVVLSLPRVPLSEVHCWGGYIGDEKSFEGMLPPGQSIGDFKKLLSESAFSFEQPYWLCNAQAIERVNKILAASGEKLASFKAAGLCT